MNDQKRRYPSGEAATFLTDSGYPIAVNTLAKLACVGGGPPFSKWGRKPLYDEESLLSWARARCSQPKRSTSDQGGVA